uniref:CLIP domain-containing serine protease n=1 Tax=Anopheles atroparvus TaxID=41427 RepID=A0A182IS78_ANOAO
MAMVVFSMIVSMLTLLTVFVRCANIQECILQIGHPGRCIPLTNCPEVHKLTKKKPLYPSDRQKIIALVGACGGNLQSQNFKVCCEFSDHVTERRPTKGLHSIIIPKSTRPMPNNHGPYSIITTTRTTVKPRQRRPSPSTTTPDFRAPKRKLPTRCGIRPPSSHMLSNVEDSEHVHTWAVFLEISRRETITGRCVGTMITDRFVLTAAHCLHHLQIDERPASEHIWSNVEDSEHVHTWAVFLEISRRETITGRCVGTMITDRFVLTAAHCLHHLQIDDVTMYFGLLKRSELTECLNDGSCQEKKAAQFIIHEEYRVHEKLNDIALILTEDAVQTSDYITPICLPLNHTFDEASANKYSSTVVSFGWGRTFGENLSDAKLVILLQVIPQDECAKSLRFNTTVLSSMMCTLGDQPGQDVCQGDSGAPLVQDYQRLMYVVGVVSSGPTCGMSTDVPGKAMRLSHYMNWILTKISRRRV